MHYNDAMKQKIYDPTMNIACWVSGKGTNYREIYNHDPAKKYFVCTNRPGCEGIKIVPENKNPPTEFNSDNFFRKMLGLKEIPRKGVERNFYDIALCTLMEQNIGREPDLICLAGYDLWVSDWMVDKYYPRILNVHPGDITKGYIGPQWVPSALAILVNDREVRSTVFVVDKGNDTGPVLVQSKPVPIFQEAWQKDLNEIIDFESRHYESIRKFGLEKKLGNVKAFIKFAENEGKPKLAEDLKSISEKLQDQLKISGDWIIYPFAVHELIAKGRVEIDGRTIYIDGKKMPPHGLRIDEINKEMLL